MGGNNPDRRQPDSTERRCLSSSPVKPFWHSTFESIWDDSEQIQLVPQHHDPPPAPLSLLVRGELSIHAIPDIDKAGTYRLYSPESTRRGTIMYEGAAATVPLEFWIQGSYMYFCHIQVSFTLRIPIYRLDKVKHTSQAAPLKRLLDSNSARWDAYKYFVATIADILEGTSALDIDGYIEKARARDDTLFDVQGPVVTLNYEGIELDCNAPNFSRDATRV